MEEQVNKETLPIHLPVATLLLEPEQLKGDGRGCVIQFEQIIDLLWIEYKINVDYIIYESLLSKDITEVVMSTGPSQRITFSKLEILGGLLVKEYRTKYSDKNIELLPYSNFPKGTIIFGVRLDNKILKMYTEAKVEKKESSRSIRFA